jgi:NAD dependent epimerase/dehydratase family enzyme
VQALLGAFDEQRAPQEIFQSQLCRQWEEAAIAAQTRGARARPASRSVIRTCAKR